MAGENPSEKPKEPVVPNPELADVGVPNPDPIRVLAEDLPENDEVQKAYKAAMLAETAQEEARHKAKAVKASPHAEETPSGAALVKVVNISNDQRRGEAYLREKSARRWGYVPVEA
jgi:hypothetical protein